MVHTVSKLLRVRSLLREIGVAISTPMEMFCDNQIALFIHVFKERTKHIEVDCHFTPDLLVKKVIVSSYVRSDNQLGDILMKPLPRACFNFLSSKLGMLELNAPT